jgi:hypothetical protein
VGDRAPGIFHQFDDRFAEASQPAGFAHLANIEQCCFKIHRYIPLIDLVAVPIGSTGRLPRWTLTVPPELVIASQLQH